MQNESELLREERGAVILEMERLAKQSDLTRRDRLEFDRLELKAKTLGTKIRAIESEACQGAEFRHQPPRIEAPIGGASPDGERWTDTMTGKEVRVLAPGQRFRSAVSCDSFEGLNFGDYCRSMVLGPRTDAEKRALSEGTDSAGGFTVPTILAAELIDRLRARAVCIAAGARTVPLPSPIFNMARVATDPVATWRSEGAPIGESGATFERVQFVAQSLGCLVRVTRELLEDSQNLSQEIPGVFGKALALELDRVCLIGTGTPPEPKGVANVSGVGSVTLGAAPSDYNPIIDAVQKLRAANAAAPTAAIMNPKVLTQFDKLQDSLHQPLQRPQSIANLPFLSTTQILTSEPDNSSPVENVASRIFVGDFSMMMIGIRTELRVELLRERYMADQGMYGFVAWLRGDVQLTHPESFAQVVQVL